MSFAQAAWLWLLPVALTLILLLHARRRRDVVVPSLVVWRQLNVSGGAAPSRSSIPWRDSSLWAQLLAAALLVLALAKPVLGGENGNWIVLLDSSLSMTAQDVEPSRHGAALERIIEGWGKRWSTNRVSIIEVGTSARLVADDWAAGPDLRSALEGLTASAGEADWAGAATRAARLLEDRGRARVVVLTDDYGVGAAIASLQAAGIATESLVVQSVGGVLANVGTDAVYAEPRGTGPDLWTIRGAVKTTGFDRGDVVRVVASYRPSGTTTFLPWGAEEVALDETGSGEFSIPLDLPGPGEVQVRGPEGDHLPADDATVLSLKSDPVRVAIVGDGHPALLRALASIGGLEAYSADEVPAPTEAAMFDLVIVTEDHAAVPATSTWWLGTVPEELRAGPPRSVAAGVLSASSHALTIDLATSGVAIDEAVPLLLPVGATALLTAGEDVLAWARTTTTGRQVAFGFDLDATDWTAQLSFPAFVASLIDWSAPRTWSHSGGACRVGEACDWPREAFGASWKLLRPDGTVVAGTPRPIVVPGDPLADAVWVAPTFERGFTPEVAGSYTLEFDTGSLALPVVTTPLGEMQSGPLAGVDSRIRGAAQNLWPFLAVLAALLLALEAITSWTRQRHVVRRRWRAPLALAGAALVAMFFSLLGIPVPGLQREGTIVWVSSDAPPLGPARGPTSANLEWITRRDKVVYDESGRIDGGADDLAAALERAVALPRGQGEVTVVVQSDPDAQLTAAEAERLSNAATTRGVTVGMLAAADSISAAGVRPDKPTLTAIELPERVRAGSKYSLIVDIHAPDEAEWRLEAVIDSVNDDGEFAANPESMPAPSAAAQVSGVGTGRAEVELQAGVSGGVVYILRLFDAHGDQMISENVVSLAIGPAPSVLLVATDANRGAGLEAALKTQGLTIDRATPRNMPGTITRLSAYDSIVLVDVAASDMFPEYQVLLERYVREFGGGLTIVGGTAAFGPGGYYATPLEEVSPLSSRITDEAPEVALTFVLDRSGSMSGAVGDSNRMDLAKAATMEAINLLGDRSLAAIVVFDTQAHVVLPLTSVVEAGAFVAALSAVAPAGGTSIYPGLLEGHELMASSASATRHIVVLTDGLSQEGDFAGIFRAMDEAGISVTFVGVGDAADRRQLTNLAVMSGGTLHMAQDFRALPSLLAQEALMLAATPIEEGVVQPRWSGDLVPEFLSEVSDWELPVLGGYVRTTLKDEASVHLYAAEGDPLLASWRYGLGRVVAFASDADGPWAQAWARDEDYGRIWSQVVRWTSEVPLREPGSVQLARRGAVLDVVVDLPAEAAGSSSPSLPLATLADTHGNVWARQRLEWVSPARAAASFELATDFVGEVTVEVSAAPAIGLVEPSLRQVAWPLPPSRSIRWDVVSLSSLVEATGGAVYHSAAEIRLTGRGAHLKWQRSPSLWHLLALVTFILSLAVRFGALGRFATIRVNRAMRTRTAWRVR